MCRPVPLADGDRLMMHDSVPSAWQPAAPVALLAHGLGGSHESGYIERLTAKLLKRGVRIGRVRLQNGYPLSLPVQFRPGRTMPQSFFLEQMVGPGVFVSLVFKLVARGRVLGALLLQLLLKGSEALVA